MRRKGEGEGEGVPEKDSIFVSALNKIDKVYTWVKAKLKSLFKLFSVSITEALLGLSSFVTSCCEKLRKVLSWINAQMDNLSGKTRGDKVVPEEGGLLVELKKLIQNMREPVDEFFKIGNSHEMNIAGLKWKRFLDLGEGFIELLQNACKQPLHLIYDFVNGYFIYCSYKEVGGVKKVVKHRGKADMAIYTLIEHIVSVQLFSFV